MKTVKSVVQGWHAAVARLLGFEVAAVRELTAVDAAFKLAAAIPVLEGRALYGKRVFDATAQSHRATHSLWARWIEERDPRAKQFVYELMRAAGREHPAIFDAVRVREEAIADYELALRLVQQLVTREQARAA